MAIGGAGDVKNSSVIWTIVQESFPKLILSAVPDFLA